MATSTVGTDASRPNALITTQTDDEYDATLIALEDTLGYTFQDRSHLKQALCAKRRVTARKHPTENNARLEQSGQAVHQILNGKAYVADESKGRSIGTAISTGPANIFRTGRETEQKKPATLVKHCIMVDGEICVDANERHKASVARSIIGAVALDSKDDYAAVEYVMVKMGILGGSNDLRGI